ncbi:MAG: HlyD family efflux transporter periplasmic adaptor subunit [Cocleimonas sp.]
MFKTIIPVLLLVGAVFLGKFLLSSGPAPKKKPFVERSPVVEVVTLKPQNYTVTIKASGIVRAGTQTNIVSEVSGRVVSISDRFQEGSYVNNNETLLSLDKANYKNAVAIVASDVAANRAALTQINEEEKSTKRSYQIARNNLALGKKDVNRLRALWNKKLIARSALDIEQQKANQLLQKVEDLQGRLNTYKSRKQATTAKIEATLARQKQERLNLSRTTLKAPYAGRIFEKKVGAGQFISKGAVLGKLYSTDYVEVDLPLSLNRYELLGLPEAFKNKAINTQSYPKVMFKNPTSLHNNEWHGRVVRTSAALDANSRQITVIARIDNPFDAKENLSSPLRIGQYIEGHIAGKTFRKVYILPSVAVRQNKEILLLEGHKVHIVPVTALWNTQNETIVKIDQALGDLSGKRLITTSLSQATEGMKVLTVQEQKNKQMKKTNSPAKVEVKPKDPEARPQKADKT